MGRASGCWSASAGPARARRKPATGRDGKKGGLAALDAATGEEKWCYADGSGPSSASPILVDLAGERRVVTMTSWALIGVSAATGKKLWGLDGFNPNGG